MRKWRATQLEETKKQQGGTKRKKHDTHTHEGRVRERATETEDREGGLAPPPFYVAVRLPCLLHALPLTRAVSLAATSLHYPVCFAPSPFPPSSLSPFISPPHIRHALHVKSTYLPTCGVGGCRVNKSRQMLWRGIKEKNTRSFASFVECLGLNGATVWISHSWLHRWDASSPNCSNIFSLSELFKNYYECILPVNFKGVAEEQVHTRLWQFPKLQCLNMVQYGYHRVFMRAYPVNIVWGPVGRCCTPASL